MLLVGAILLAIFVLPSPWGVVAIVGGAVGEAAEAAVWLWLSRRRRAVTGAEALVGTPALVVEPCRPEGFVRIAGELWRARCDAGADRGKTVVVERVEGLTLVVGPTRGA